MTRLWTRWAGSACCWTTGTIWRGKYSINWSGKREKTYVLLDSVEGDPLSHFYQSFQPRSGTHCNFFKTFARECFNFKVASRLETYTVRKSVKNYGRSHFQILLNDPRNGTVTPGKSSKIEENRQKWPSKQEPWKRLLEMWSNGRVDSALGYVSFAFFHLEFDPPKGQKRFAKFFGPFLRVFNICAIFAVLLVSFQTVIEKSASTFDHTSAGGILVGL